MSAHCPHDHPATEAGTSHSRYRKILWIALAINLAMFMLEIGAGLRAGSASLLADAIDFFGDSANYAVTLVVLSMGGLWRARAAWLKGGSMLVFGLCVMARALWMFTQGGVPEAFTMGGIGLLALLANGAVALMLYAWREGDANMRSVWLCSRNDALGNLAVMAAALGVFGTGSAWPDLAVAGVMAGLAITSGWTVMRQARRELKTLKPVPQAATEHQGF
ncbi:cation transporter [Polaromonas jejuensis]|uniref:Cation transporter n=1 Tax=Polaromonas jejuensis TaxID=457502 RepID=A0ABW0Q4U4_9BURK|nr:cation transporter [Polaromonas jejuensis]